MARYSRLMRVGWIAFVVVVGSVGGTKPNPASTCADGACSDPAFPYCDVDGIDGEPDTCIAVTCTPNTFAICRGDSAVTCNDSGNSYDTTACPNGCYAAGCLGSQHLEPKSLPTVCATLATVASLDVSSSATFDTDLASNCNGGVVTQLNAPDICVVRYGTISVEAGQTLLVSGYRVVALVADGPLILDGTLDVGATGAIDGPGASIDAVGGTAMNEAGAGGAGFKTVGGAGGSASTDGGAMNGGVALTDPS